MAQLYRSVTNDGLGRLVKRRGGQYLVFRVRCCPYFRPVRRLSHKQRRGSSAEL